MIAYGVYFTGVYAAFSFIGTFLYREYGLTQGGIGTAMIVIGAGGLLGSLSGGYIVQTIGPYRAFVSGMTIILLNAITLPLWSKLAEAELVLTVSSFIGGMMFPLLMSALQSLLPTARGTISSLGSAIMYGGSTVGATLGGLLYGWGGSFAMVSWFAAFCYFLSYMLFLSSRLFAPSRKAVAGVAERG